MSPADKDQGMINEFPYNQDDQLSYILELIGSPDPSCDYEFVSDKQALRYLKKLPKSSIDKFATHYPEADKVTIDLLKKLLTFDPSKRISIEECLKHQFFDDVIENGHEVSQIQPIIIHFEEILGGRLEQEKLRDLFMSEFKISEA